MSSHFLGDLDDTVEKLTRRVNKLEPAPYSLSDYIPTVFSSAPTLPAKVNVDNVQGLSEQLEQKMDKVDLTVLLDDKVGVSEIYAVNGELDRLRRLVEMLIGEIDDLKLQTPRDSVSSFEMVDN